MRTPLLSLVLFLLAGSIFGQKIEVKGAFLSDSIHIGERVGYSLSVKYPQEKTVFFPNQEKAFEHFKVKGKKVFPTTTIDSLSKDSVIYDLVTFDVAPTQFLQVPIYMVQQKDCTHYQSNKDSIYFQSVLPGALDTIQLDDLPLKEQVSFYPLQRQRNYYQIGFIVGIVLCALISLFVWFEKPIKRRYMLYRLQKNYYHFETLFTQQISKTEKEQTVGNIEKTVGVWKKYLEQLEGVPYPKLTTKETVQITEDEDVTQNLNQIDKAIYANQKLSNTSFSGLKNFAHRKYNQKLESIQHG